MEFTSHVSLFQKCFYKSPDNNDPRANSRSMSKFVTIANWQICCFIAKFSINLQFCYKLLFGLSWGQSLHQNCKDVKLHITCLIPGLAWPLYPLQSSLHDIIRHVFTGTDTRPEHTPHTTRFVTCPSWDWDQLRNIKLYCIAQTAVAVTSESSQSDRPDGPPHAVCPDINMWALSWN